MRRILLCTMLLLCYRTDLWSQSEVSSSGPPLETSQPSIQRDASALQLSQAVVQHSGFSVLSNLSTETLGQIRDADTGITEQVRIVTSGDRRLRFERGEGANLSVRVIANGAASYRNKEQKVNTIPAVDCVGHLFPNLPSLGLLAALLSPNASMIDKGLVTLHDSSFHEIDVSWPRAIAKVNGSFDESGIQQYSINQNALTVEELHYSLHGGGKVNSVIPIRVAYRQYSTESARYIPHEVATSVAERLLHTLTITQYREDVSVPDSVFQQEQTQ